MVSHASRGHAAVNHWGLNATLSHPMSLFFSLLQTSSKDIIFPKFYVSQDTGTVSFLGSFCGPHRKLVGGGTHLQDKAILGRTRGVLF